MTLFSSPSQSFFDGYHKMIPRLEPYYEERQVLYKLFHQLNHYVMFGFYAEEVLTIMESLLAFAESQDNSRQSTAG